ncbi:hypothetical protein GCM10009776_12150 [Microbacterium deminutum]|uniref:Uncharacterized protein n=1 Tax=Microbacterium deminutum TaxID=344164 RepID=A0ABN2QGY9_9MICO
MDAAAEGKSIMPKGPAPPGVLSGAAPEAAQRRAPADHPARELPVPAASQGDFPTTRGSSTWAWPTPTRDGEAEPGQSCIAAPM